MTSAKKPRSFKRAGWKESTTRTFSSSTSSLGEQFLEDFKDAHPQLRNVIPPRPPRAFLVKLQEIVAKNRSIGPNELPPPIDVEEVMKALAKAQADEKNLRNSGGDGSDVL